MKIRVDQAKGKPEPISTLNRILLNENNESLVDLRVHTPKAKLLRPTLIPYLRESVANMISAAIDRLPEGVYLEVMDAWRPLLFQKRMYDLIMSFAKEAYPKASYALLRRKVNRWVAPYDQKAPPGHCTGAAVDVRLIDETFSPLDVTSPFGVHMNTYSTYVLGLSKIANQNRMLLVDTMLGVGFSNCRDEWWHYSYGDAGWAVRFGYSSCCYGLVELPLELWADQKSAVLEKGYSWSKKNPFLRED